MSSRKYSLQDSQGSGLIEFHRAEQFGVENKLLVALIYLVPLDTKNPADEMEKTTFCTREFFVKTIKAEELCRMQEGLCSVQEDITRASLSAIDQVAISSFRNVS